MQIANTERQAARIKADPNRQDGVDRTDEAADLLFRVPAVPDI